MLPSGPSARVAARGLTRHRRETFERLVGSGYVARQQTVGAQTQCFVLGFPLAKATNEGLACLFADPSHFQVLVKQFLGLTMGGNVMLFATFFV